MKSTSMILAMASLLVCINSVQMFKFGKSAPPPPPPLSPPPPPQQQQQVEHLDYAQPMYLAPAPTRYYPMPAELLRQPLMAEPQYAPASKGFEFHASKTFGKAAAYVPAPAPVAPLAAPQSIAYLVVRPIPSALRPQIEQARYLQPAAKIEDTKGGRALAVQEPQLIEQAPLVEPQQYAAYYQPQPAKVSGYQAAVKGGRQTEEQAEQQIQQIEQQHEQITEEQQLQQQQLQQQPQPQQPALIVPVVPGKEGKLKAMLDRLMSKLTLGSSYHVLSEEIVAPPQAALPAAPIQQQHIEQQQQQLTTEDQRLEQQLEQQRDNGFEEGATKQAKGAQQQPLIVQQQEQQQLKEEPVQLQQQQQQSKGQQQEIFRQEPLEAAAPAKGIKQQQQQQQQFAINQEPLRQEAAKGTY